MARQNTQPVQFQRQQRRDDSVLMTSGRAGKVNPIGYMVLNRGDSASGQVGIDVELGQMPRPLLNAAVANIQAWCIPKSVHPQFSGIDEFRASYQGDQINQLGSAARDAPDFYNVTKNATEHNTVRNSELFKQLGLHVGEFANGAIQTDLVDAFNLAYNFRLAAHSSRLERKKYFLEDPSEAVALPPAFWPSGRFSRVVPDYERALIVGGLDLDVVSGQIPIQGLYYDKTNLSARQYRGWDLETGQLVDMGTSTTVGTGVNARLDTLNPDILHPIYAEMEGQSMGVTLAGIDKARSLQSFAKLRSSYAGNDHSGFANDNTLVAELMRGFAVGGEEFKRPILLDNKRIPFGMTERHAMDGTNLDKSVSQGRVSTTLSLNVPVMEDGATIIVTLEVLPERLDERQSDEWLYNTEPSDLPDALRDVLRPEPVDMVLNRRLDARHASPSGLYGYEPMNDVWNRSTTRLGGAFYQSDPTNPWTEQRSAIWQTSIVDPTFTKDHWLVPEDFPHDVFADKLAPAYEAVVRHTLSIVGLTQIGDVLTENNDDYDGITELTSEE